jgi:peptidoglycan/LPS O-acetylase OafA/YrhL
LDQIGFGILLYCLAVKWDPWLSKNRLVAGLLCMAGFFLAAGIYFGTFIVEGLDRVYSPSFLAMGLVLFLLGGRHLDFFESKFLTWLSWPGKYCYGAYLLHIPMIYLTHSFLLKLHTSAAFVVLAALTTALAALSYHFFELPLNLWLRRRLNPAPATRNTSPQLRRRK